MRGQQPSQDHNSRLDAAPSNPTRVQPEEAPFLQGPKPRIFELIRIVRIFFEFLRGFRTLHFVGPCVTVFGSSRFAEDHHYYGLAREMGRRLGQAGFTVMTGGGPGLMEAANRGARESGGRSVGCAIDISKEEPQNHYLDIDIEFHYFFVRKVMLVKYSHAFVVFPGGIGTLDEVFETLCLIQTDKIRNFPLILMGVEYWQPLLSFLKHKMVPEGTVDPFEVDRILLTDSPDDAFRLVESTLPIKPGPKRLWPSKRFGPFVEPRSDA